ncbi:hypothetical protein GUITHDRAFT_120179 [Guillardia theta CCMP2712]|uniref:Uncharacterized protein n=1 Tax=Guillardia theta (strain CCMP2712) TaxID=905079 RepID=L1IBL7_GUITC|nr:hypothetical protein GUITHDRAFT_120179 [Guillardia theta CCMP2712]EKX33651.1 hypothetical protein GUITHDRAFT_120179 [Guillardia theta CCMP2712]|eukprot:XP_005820631.1 hypothetical protein GUITHDRAFT_120179 [Guillardia theta CCMP2712]
MPTYSKQNGKIYKGSWNKENMHHQTFKKALADNQIDHHKIIFKADGSVMAQELDALPIWRSDRVDVLANIHDGDYLYLHMVDINNMNADKKYVHFYILKSNAEVELGKAGITEEQKAIWTKRKAYDERMMNEAKALAMQGKLVKWQTRLYSKPIEAKDIQEGDFDEVSMWNPATGMPTRYNLDYWIVLCNENKAKKVSTPKLKQLKQEKKAKEAMNANPQAMVTGASQFNGGMDSDSELSEDDDISGALNSAARNLYM